MKNPINFVFGICMGAVIYRLLEKGEYAHVLFAIVALICGCVFIIE